MPRSFKRPSPATVIALAALVVASSGSALAASLITSKQIKNGTIQLADISAKAKKALRSAGPAGPAGTPGAAGRSALEPLRSGETIRGVWALNGHLAQNFEDAGVTFPVPAPVAVDSAHVVFAGNDSVAGDGCAGSAVAPVSAPGFVCLYFATANGTQSAGGYGARASYIDATATGDGSSYGFAIQVSSGLLGGFEANGTWAYTAP